MAKVEIHISDIRTYLSCRRKWNWASMLREGLEPNVPYAPFFTGRAVHWCLQHYYENGSTPGESLTRFLEAEIPKFGTLWEREQELVAEQVELISGMMEHYVLWAPKEKGLFADENLDFISLETSFSVPIRAPTGRSSPKVFLAGRFDGLVRRRDNGTFWLFESKTARSIDELQHTLANDMQAGAYIYAAQELTGEHVSGVLYNVMRKKVPSTPRILVNGTLSKAANIDTTAYHYAQVALEHHDGDRDYVLKQYGDIINQLIDKGNTFFARVPIRRTQDEIGQLMSDVHLIALEMTRDSVPIYPNPGWSTCNFCHFRSPCLAMNAGANYEYILEVEYRQRQPWDSLQGSEFNGETD